MPDARTQRQYIKHHIDNVASVIFMTDDTIRVRCRDGRHYTMRFGADQDVYQFVNDADESDVVTFPVLSDEEREQE